MFIALDESISTNFLTIGCVVLPKAKLPELEKKQVQTRLDYKLWGEIKWSKGTQSYLEKYKLFLGNYLLDKEVTFHSWTLKRPTADEIRRYYDGDGKKILYKHAYLLIRNVIRKCRNAGYKGEFYVLPDTTGEMGKNEYVETQKILKSDSNIYPPATVEFCAEGNSQVCGALQVADLCTGAVGYTYEKDFKDTSYSEGIVDYLKEINGGIDINFEYPSLPRMKQFKLHHCFYKPNVPKWVRV